MPLVSGVCRTASAPMLSHGGSRLNASKPEANPKTRYPYNTQPSQHPSSAVVCSNDLSLLTVVNYELFLAMTNLFGIRVKALPRVESLLSSREFSSNRFPIESPHKPLLPAQPRWRQVSHIITSGYFSSQASLTAPPAPKDTRASIPKRRRQTHNLFQSQRPSPNERTCIGWHKRYASVSGRSSRGIYVPRR